MAIEGEKLEAARREIVTLIMTHELPLEERTNRVLALAKEGVDLASHTERVWPSNAYYFPNLLHLAVTRPNTFENPDQFTPAEPEMIELLVEAGADPNLASSDGETVFDQAVQFGGSMDAVRKLYELGGRPNMSLTQLVRHIDTEMAKVLLELGMPLEVEKGVSPLHEAILAVRLDLVELFLDEGARTDITIGKKKRTLREIAEQTWIDLDPQDHDLSLANRLLDRLAPP